MAADRTDSGFCAPQPVSDAELRSVFGGLRPNRTIALAVSGGTDSLALAALAARWQRQFAPAARLIAYVVDHGLRESSRDEAQQACALVRSRGIEGRVLNCEGHVPDSGLQARARLARYDLMVARGLIDGAAVLLTAHHAGDQAETILMRARRGDPGGGYRGIPHWGEWSGLALHRPLLGLSRARLAATLAAMGLTPIEDQSNSDTRFERVRMRQLLAAQPNPALAELAFCRLAAIGAEKQADVDDRAATLFHHFGVYHPQGFVTVDANVLDEDLESFCTLLAGVVHRVGGQVRPPRRDQVMRLAQQLADVDAGHTVRTTLACACVVKRDGRLFIFREIGRNQADSIHLEAGIPAIFDRRFRVVGKQNCMAGYAVEKDIDAMAEPLIANGIPSVIARAVAGGFPSAFGAVGADLSAQPLAIFWPASGPYRARQRSGARPSTLGDVAQSFQHEMKSVKPAVRRC